VLLLRHISPIKKFPRIALEGVPSLYGALVRKLQKQFQVVKLEEVFRTAVEVDGTPVPEKPAESKPGNRQLRRPAAGAKGSKTRKRE
jgi:hypothetical protein